MLKKIIKLIGIFLFFLLSPIYLLAQTDENKYYEYIEYIRNDNLQKIEELIANGMNVNQRFKYDDTLLMYAAGEGNERIVKFLLFKKANINDINVDGRNVLMIAIMMGQEDIVNLLIKNGADLRIEDKNNKTALLWAVTKNYPAIVKSLVAAGADINQQNRDGRTALMEAACLGYAEIIEFLISKKVDLNLRDNNNATALTLAIEFDQTRAAEILRKAGAAYSTPKVSRKEIIEKIFPKSLRR